MFSGTPEIQELQQPSMNSNIRIGVYGVSGAGKTSLLNEITPILGNKCKLVEGSQLIANLAEGGMAGFLSSTEKQKHAIREQAIESLQNVNQPIIITCHYYLYSDKKFERVMTDADKRFFTHIIYLDYPSEDVFNQLKNDKTRFRETVSKSEVFFSK